MEAVSYSAFRNNLRTYLDKACDDSEPIIVTSQNPDSNVVVLSVRDYENMRENLYIESNKYLRDKIDEGIAQIRAGKARIHDLIEVEDD